MTIADRKYAMSRASEPYQNLVVSKPVALSQCSNTPKFVSSTGSGLLSIAPNPYSSNRAHLHAAIGVLEKIPDRLFHVQLTYMSSKPVHIQNHMITSLRVDKSKTIKSPEVTILESEPSIEEGTVGAVYFQPSAERGTQISRQKEVKVL